MALLKPLKLSRLCLLLALLATVASCSLLEEAQPDDTPSALPPETQRGLNTWGCKVNGEIFVPESGGFMGRSSLSTSFFSDRFFMRGSNSKTSRALSIIIEITPTWARKPGVYILDGSWQDPNAAQRRNGAINEFINGSLKYGYDTNNQYTGKLEVTYVDSINYIISGRFEFTAVNGIDTLHVTEGRFDIQSI